MGSNQQYTMWFVNDSINAGNVCVYQDNGNVTCNQGNPMTLAWMLTGANPLAQVKFQWAIDYDFAWFDKNEPMSQQIIEASLNDTGCSVKFRMNQYGYYFADPAKVSQENQLSIQSDSSIPSVNKTIIGIGMHGSGAFGLAAKPNTNYTFTLSCDAALVYWISFGYYIFDENDPIDISTLNLSTKMIFPSSVYTMTAVLNSDNTWNTYAGSPTEVEVGALTSLNFETVIYEAGKGIVVIS